ncbi:dynamin family protein [Selenomonas ruminantium]|uniref:Small GTP-binding protein domain-containing protein n=1 Tax=Selenomonas ruminantium TaxID=971 RepID=A0A1H3VS61_SELRU|nr:dynamin family protein [Selenomonas ruminantium]SDZ76952.1 small GTP-binding protein domain-containing protein [Selenomonas ruminantium]
MKLDDIKNYIDEVLDKAQSSPLLNVKDLSEMNSIIEDIKLLKSKIKQPLRIAVMGEVKAGKSTLINAFAGGEVAPTNVTEATAAIMVVEYSDERNAYVCYKDGSRKNDTIENVYDLLRANENDQAFFRNIDYVKIETPLNGLKDITIVDTPGLATITEENAMVTRDHFQHVDVVLWVLNANYLGQSEVNDELRDVAKMGKPIIAVLNRIDEIDGDIEELIEYVDDNLGIYLKSIKPLSGKLAYDAVINNDLSAMSTSGFDDLYNYLIDNIERHSDDVKLDSIKESAQTLDKKFDYIHLESEKNIELLFLTYNDIEKNVMNARNNVYNKIVSNTSFWVNNEFLNDAFNVLNEKINDIGVFSSGSSTSIDGEITRVFSNSTEVELQRYISSLQSKILHEWELELDNVNSRTLALFQQASLTRVNDYNRIVGIVPVANENSSEITDSVIAAGAIGSTLAVCAATVGPGAAYVSLGAALGSFLPPVLIAGAVVGGVKKFMQNANTKKKYHMAVNDTISRIRNDVEIKIKDAITQYMDEIYRVTINQSKEDFVRNNLAGYSLEEFSQFYQSLVQFNRKYEISDNDSSGELITIPLLKNEIRDNISSLSNVSSEEDAVVNDDNVFRCFSKIAGISQNGRQDVARKLKTKCQLIAVRMPYNESDENAIALFSPRGGQLGFIKKELAIQLAPQIDAGKTLRVFANEVTGGNDGKLIGVNISIELGYFHPEDYSLQEGLKWFYSPNDSDDEKAFQCFKKAAEYKMPEAITMLGEMYQYGYGCNLDDLRALSLYDEASQLGNARGSFRAGWLTLHRHFRFDNANTPIPKEDLLRFCDKSTEYYKLALQQGGYDDQANILEEFKQNGYRLSEMDMFMVNNRLQEGDTKSVECIDASATFTDTRSCFRNKSEIFNKLFVEHFPISYQNQIVLEAMNANLLGRDENDNMYEIMESIGKNNPYVSKDGYVKDVDEYDLDEGVFGAMIIYVALGDLRGNLTHLLTKLNWNSNFNEAVMSIHDQYGDK